MFEFYARAFGISPSIAKGDVQDNSKAMEETLTTCLEPLAKSIQTEINRKRNGRAAVLSGTYCMIDTKYVKHVDMFDVSTQVDKEFKYADVTLNTTRLPIKAQKNIQSKLKKGQKRGKNLSQLDVMRKNDNKKMP